MKKFYSLLVFLLFATPVFSQVLDNPRIERMNRGYNSSYNYFLSIDSDGYIMKTDVDINDFRKLEENLKATQNTITEQKREIDELKRTISNLEKKIDKNERDLYDLKKQNERNLNDLKKQMEKESVLLDQIAETFELRRNSDDPEVQKKLYKKIDSLSLEAAQYAIPSEYDKCIASLGGTSTNAGTSYDLTVYINEIPSNQIEKWLRLEADRFENVKLRLFHTELETVYEEFNMYQDMDRSRFNQAMNEVLYKNHPYSRDVIGLPEHLKLPSMKDIYTFHDTYYVPNNMAVALSGDIDYEETIKLIDKYFGKLEKKDLPERKKYVADPINGPQIVEVYGPESEMVKIVYRFDNNPTNELMLSALSTVLYNGKSGIIDLELVQSQQVLNAYAYSSGLNDYLEFGLFGKPREGQTLEEVKDLLFEKLEKVKTGEFDDDILEAALNNYLKNEVESNEYNTSRAYGYMMSFIEGKDYIDNVSFLDKFSKITKDQVVDFAKTNFADNYVLGYKRFGTPQNIVKVEKPEISEVPINRDAQSDFASDLGSMTVKDIEPVFVDYNKEITHKNFKDGLDFYYVKNNLNDIFKLYYIIDMGKFTNLKLPIAIDYLTYLGTDEYTPEELQKELYKLALTFSVRAGNDMSYVYISGLNDKFEEAVELLEHIIHNAVADKDAYDKYVDGILKKRANDKINPDRILWSAMRQYGTYGEDNPARYILSEEELKNTDPQELVDLVKELFNYEHLVFYYGSEPVSKVSSLIEKNILFLKIYYLYRKKKNLKN
jgi:zinc protease